MNHQGRAIDRNRVVDYGLAPHIGQCLILWLLVKRYSAQTATERFIEGAGMDGAKTNLSLARPRHII